MYFLTEDLHNEKERNELEFLRQIDRVVIVTPSPQKKNDLGLRQISLPPIRPALLRAQVLWSRLCLLFCRIGNSRNDHQFPTRNLYTGNVLVRGAVNALWRVKRLPWINRWLPRYDTLYFAPLYAVQCLLGFSTRHRSSRFARLIIHDALLVRLSSLAPFVARARRDGIQTVANVKSWDNPFYSQLTTRAAGYLVWSESMWRDIVQVHTIDAFHYAWGARPFFKFLTAMRNAQPQRQRAALSDPSLQGERLVVGYAAAFCDTHMGRHEVDLVRRIAEHLARHLPQCQLLFRPYPSMQESFYDPIRTCPNVGIVGIGGAAIDRFGDGREIIRFGSDAERLAYIDRCHCFLSLGTSFSIEAATACLPLVQFYLEPPTRRSESEHAIFERFDISDHLLRYYLPLLNVARSYDHLTQALQEAGRREVNQVVHASKLLQTLGVPFTPDPLCTPPAELKSALLGLASSARA